MEVICVDSSQNKSVPDDVKCCAGLLKEGEIYTVIQEHRCGYNLLECPHPYNPEDGGQKVGLYQYLILMKMRLNDLSQIRTGNNGVGFYLPLF